MRDLECFGACLGSNTRLVFVRWHSLGEHLLFRHVLQGSFHLRDRSTNTVFWFDPIITSFTFTRCASSVPRWDAIYKCMNYEEEYHETHHKIASKTSIVYTNTLKYFAMLNLNITQSIMLRWQRRWQHQAWHKFPKISGALTQSSFKA